MKQREDNIVGRIADTNTDESFSELKDFQQSKDHIVEEKTEDSDIK